MENNASSFLSDDGECVFTKYKLMKLTPTDKIEFAKFNSARLSFRTIQVTVLIGVLLTTYFFIMALWHPSTKTRGFDSITVALVFTVALKLPALTLIHVLRRVGDESPRRDYIMSWTPVVEVVSALASTLSLGVCLLARVYNGQCRSLNQVDMWSCSSEMASRALPQEHLVMLMIYPLLHSSVLKALRFEYVLASWVLAIMFMFAAAGWGNAMQSFPAIIVYIPLSGVILFENYRQDLILFFVVKRQKKLLAENRRMADEQATEMRHMIANVAHDLKTVSHSVSSSFCFVSLFSNQFLLQPLSAFMNGVESIRNAMDSVMASRDEYYEAIDVKPFDVALVHSQILENIRNLFNVNDFMTMTINRCIDYTKVCPFKSLVLLCSLYFAFSRRARASNWSRVWRRSI